MVSITRPSRGERWSATTTRHMGSLLPPTRVSLSLTDTVSSLLVARLLPAELRRCARQRPRSASAARERADIRDPAAPDLAHHLAHLAELLDQAIDVLNGGPRAAGDPQPARPLDQLRAAALLGGHRQDDRLNPVQLALVHFHILHLPPRAE